MKISEINTTVKDRTEDISDHEQLRLEKKLWRTRLKEETVRRLSHEIVLRLKKQTECWPQWETYDVFLCYAAAGNEVCLEEYYRLLLSSGKKLCFPRTEGKRMEFYVVKDMDRDFRIGTFGIREPQTQERLEGTENAVAFVPGIVFDEQLHRIGYGGGYYDRYLSEHGKIKTIGICYEGQLVRKMVPAPWDVSMDALVTERRVIEERSQPWN